MEFERVFTQLEIRQQYSPFQVSHVGWMSRMAFSQKRDPPWDRSYLIRIRPGYDAVYSMRPLCSCIFIYHCCFILAEEVPREAVWYAQSISLLVYARLQPLSTPEYFPAHSSNHSLNRSSGMGSRLAYEARSDHPPRYFLFLRQS